MELSLTRLTDKHKSKPAVVCGHGPSLNGHLSCIEKLQTDDKIIRFSVNNWWDFFKLPPHYHVIANSEITVRTEYHLFNRYGSVLVYANSVDWSEEVYVDKLTIDFIRYNQRHFAETPKYKCGCPYCLGCVPLVKSIQETLQEYTGFEKHYSSGDSGVLHAIALSVLCGCNPIYVSGVDLYTTPTYADKCNGKDNSAEKERNYGLQFVDNIVSDLGIINDSAKKIGVQIFDLSLSKKDPIQKVKEISL